MQFQVKFDLEVFRPPYPNKSLEGISKAHNFALRYYIRYYRDFKVKMEADGE